MTFKVWIAEGLDNGSLNQNMAIQQSVYTTFEQETLTAATTSQSVAYSAEKDTHLIKNTGSVTCYINFDSAATTDDFRLDAGDFISVDTNATTVTAITASSTTVLRIIGQS